jgi:glutamine amidotransferase
VSPPSSSAPRVAVVDYGAGNLRSVSRALARSGLVPDVTSDPRPCARPTASYCRASARSATRSRSSPEAARQGSPRGIEAGRPYLGLCLGLQLLFDESDEHGVTPGFGVLAGRVERFPAPGSPGAPARVPHIGWNEVRFAGDHALTRRLPRSDRFYFVHAYRAVPRDPAIIAGVVDYGGPFAAAVAVDNVFAVQFHRRRARTPDVRCSTRSTRG